MVKELKDIKDFADVLGDTNTGLVVIDFFADWCGPCKMIAPKFAELSEKYADVGFYKINSDNPDMQDVCQVCKIRSLPTFCFFRGGKFKTSMMGANAEKLEKLIKQNNVKDSESKD